MRSNLASRLLALVALVAILRLASDAAGGAAPALFAVVSVLAATSVTALAARRFAADDPPRRPWALRAAALALVLAARLADPLQTALAGPAGVRAAHVLLIAANALGAAAMLGFLGVIRAAGLTPRLRGPGGLALAAAALLALAAASSALAHLSADLQNPGAPAAWVHALAAAASTVADAIVFVAGAALLRALAPMRDGAAAWPYLLLAIDGACFLAIDLAAASAAPEHRGLIALLGALGGAAGLTAAVAQIAVLRRGLGPP